MAVLTLERGDVGKRYVTSIGRFLADSRKHSVKHVEADGWCCCRRTLASRRKGGAGFPMLIVYMYPSSGPWQ